MPADRKSLDDEGRFGFMKTNKACTCIGCTARLSMEDSRVYDNQIKGGPFCLSCARKALGTSDQESKETAALADIAEAILAAVASPVWLEMNESLKSIARSLEVIAKDQAAAKESFAPFDQSQEDALAKWNRESTAVS